MSTQEIRILDGASGPQIPIIDGDGDARAIVWPGIGARSRSLHRLWLGENSSTVQLRHPSEAVYYVIEGDGFAVDGDTGERFPLRRGSMFHIDPNTPYVIEAGQARMDLVGGPSPADDTLYQHLSEGGLT